MVIMTPLRPTTALGTHTVENQPPERGDLDLWARDRPLREAVARAGGGAVHAVATFGRAIGSFEMRLLGRLAGRHPPELQVFDRAGRRLDAVAFHPAYHRLMAEAVTVGYAALPWATPGGHAAHAAMVYLLSQVEPGVCCPLTMTYAAVPALRADAGLSAAWERRIATSIYDAADRPAPEKAGATIGMAMTEKQGGSDIRTNRTRAEPDGFGWRLTGHKWFCSAPMSDAFLTLAQVASPGGDRLTCFLVPRWAPDGTRNAIRLMRLKDKLGNRSNASAEIEYAGAFAWALGPVGDGVRTIIEMVHHTRLDTATAPAGLMRAALDEALWWCEGRMVFGRRLIEQPLMTAVLADLCLEVEAATALALRVAAAFDSGDRPFARIAVSLAKFLNNRRAPAVIAEAMECLGGVGYVEEGPMAMLYREAPLNGIWEGSGNVICLDVLRSLSREPGVRDRLIEELETARGIDRRYDTAFEALGALLSGEISEGEARCFVERLATLLTAAVLLRADIPVVAEAHVATRVAAEGGARILGALPRAIDRQALLARALPC